MILHRLYALLLLSLIGCSVRSEPQQETPATAPITPVKAPQSTATPVTKPIDSLPTSAHASVAPNSLVIERDRITLLHHEKSIEIPNTAGQYSIPTLEAILLAIKKEHPQDDSMLLQARDETPYAAIIDITDVLRKSGFLYIKIATP